MPNNYVLLETIEVTSPAASVTFDNIPQTGYTDLKIVGSARVNSTFGNPWYDTYITVNSGGQILWRDIIGLGSSISSRNNTSLFPTLGVTSSGAAGNTFGNFELHISNYNSTTAHKAVSMDAVSENNGTAAINQISAGRYASNTAISSITITPYNSPTGSFAQYSTFSLYATAAVGTTPAVAPKATGGNLVATDGTYWYHAFTSSGNFIPQTSLNAKIMVIGGGAGGGAHIAGGGGAGAINDFTSTYTLTGNTSYVCTIGAGGGGNTGTAKGSPGISSVFSGLGTTITANGGGYGGGNDVFPGGPGGSGGGAAASGGGAAGGTASGPNTFAGGSGWYGPYPIYSAGGGGGATAAGGNGSTTASVGGNGGQGMLLSSIDSNLTTVLAGALSGMTRVSSGGGGCGQNPAGGAQTGGTGGTGGGNGGFSTTNATNATSYGSGGGGGNWSDAGGGATGDGGNGYQGIVIIRYPVAS